jgi:hypothetical protein
MSDVAAYHVFVCALFTGAGRYADCRESDDRNKTEIVSINLLRIAFEIFNLHNGTK